MPDLFPVQNIGIGCYVKGHVLECVVVCKVQVAHFCSLPHGVSPTMAILKRRVGAHRLTLRPGHVIVGPEFCTGADRKRGSKIVTPVVFYESDQ